MGSADEEIMVTEAVIIRVDPNCIRVKILPSRNEIFTVIVFLFPSHKTLFLAV